MANKEVKLLGMWASSFALRGKWALKLNGIEYVYVEDDLLNKSPLLLQYNPVHKKIPVLVHDGKPVAESVVIVEYIEETWKDHSILSEDADERAMARFWAKFVDEKLWSQWIVLHGIPVRNGQNFFILNSYMPSNKHLFVFQCIPAMFGVFSTQGDQQERFLRKLKRIYKMLEMGLQGKKFFAGERIGFAGIVASWIPYWLRIQEEILALTMVDEETKPLLNIWFRDYLDLEEVKALLPPRDKLFYLTADYQQSLLAAAT